MKKIIILFCILTSVLLFTACAQDNIPSQPTQNVATPEPTISPDTKIERIYDHTSFKNEFSKLIDFSLYTAGSGDPSYDVYTLLEDSPIKESNANFEIDLSGTKITLPVTVSEILEAGYKVKEISGKSITDADLEKNYHYTSIIFEDSEGKTFSGYLHGDKNGNTAPLKDCLITQITLSYQEGNKTSIENISDSQTAVVFFDSISKDTSLDSIIKTLGNPTLIRFYEDSISDHIQLRYDLCDSDGNSGDLAFSIYTVSDEEAQKVEFTDYITYISYRIVLD